MLSGFPMDNNSFLQTCILENKTEAWAMKADGDIQALSKVDKIRGSEGCSFMKEDL